MSLPAAPDRTVYRSPASLSRTCSTSLCSPPESHIFERSVQDFGAVQEFLPELEPYSPTSPPLQRRQLYVAQLLFRMKNEDQIAPSLDATTELLNDLSANLDDVEMVYPSRRNSSVLGLSMALGRPSLLRRSSAFQLPVLNAMLALAQAPLQSSPQRTNLLLNFISYADMINNDEFARRPAVRSAPSFGALFDPLSKPLDPVSGKMRSRVNSIRKSITPGSPSLDALVHLDLHPLSPDLLDSEDFKRPVSRRQSIASSFSVRNVPPTNLCLDDESFVSTSIGDCIRQSTSEIGHK